MSVSALILETRGHVRLIQLLAQANHTGLSAATEDACLQMQKADSYMSQRDSDIRHLKSRLAAAESALAAAESAAGHAQDRAARLEGQLAPAVHELAE